MENVTWTDKPGLAEAIAKAGHLFQINDGVPLASNAAAVQAIIDGYDPLPYLKAQKQAKLFASARDRIDLFKLIDAGAATNITGTQFAAFMAAITNRYRTLKAAITGAATIEALDAIDLTAGWPANP